METFLVVTTRKAKQVLWIWWIEARNALSILPT